MTGEGNQKEGSQRHGEGAQRQVRFHALSHTSHHERECRLCPATTDKAFLVHTSPSPMVGTCHIGRTTPPANHRNYAPYFAALRRFHQVTTQAIALSTRKPPHGLRFPTLHCLSVL